MLEGRTVTFAWLEDEPMQGIVDHEFEDGGLTIKFGKAQWLYLPIGSPIVREIREQARIETGE